ncbi:MAG: NUDIX hydrolase [Oscillospiraceae bacterium]|nr:NUDIX hydrolase [Oscillospiraceae bacterium]
MPLTANAHHEQLLQYMPVHEAAIAAYTPLTGAYVIFEHNEQFLFAYNTWRRQWELPSGGIEPGESPRQCSLPVFFFKTGVWGLAPILNGSPF